MDYDENKYPCFLFEQMNVMPNFLFLVVNTGIVVINCIRCAKALFFSMIVDSI